MRRSNGTYWSSRVAETRLLARNTRAPPPRGRFLPSQVILDRPTRVIDVKFGLNTQEVLGFCSTPCRRNAHGQTRAFLCGCVFEFVVASAPRFIVVFLKVNKRQTAVCGRQVIAAMRRRGDLARLLDLQNEKLALMVHYGAAADEVCEGCSGGWVGV